MLATHLVAFIRYSGFILLTNIVFSAPISAAVSWERMDQRIQATPDAETVTFSLSFVVSDSAVTFQASEIPCGCAFAESDRPTYQPGERGVFTVRMLVEDRVGTQEFEVTAKTDDPAMPEQVLKLTAAIPELLQFNRKIAVWDKTSGNAPQQITCTVAPGYAVTAATIVSQHAAVAASVVKTGDPQIYAIDFSLVDPAYRKPVKVIVTTDLPVKRQATATLWAVNRLP